MSLACIGFSTGFEIENEREILWTATGCNSLIDSKWVTEESGFLQQGRDVQMLVHAHGQNVLNREGVRRVFDVIDSIRTVAGYKETCGVASQNPHDDAGCNIEAVTGFWLGHNRSIFESVVQSDKDLRIQVSKHAYANGEPVNRLEILACPTSHSRKLS